VGCGTGDCSHVAHGRPVVDCTKQSQVGCGTGDCSHVAHGIQVAVSPKHDNDSVVAIQ
jgi:hypothetical protein